MPYGSVHVDDLAVAYLAALERAPAGALYNLVGSTLPMREVAIGVSHAVGAAGRTVSLTPEEAHAAWTPRGPSLTYELILG